MPRRKELISTVELAGIIDQPDLRVFDCTTYLEPAPVGSDVPYIAVPGNHTFEAGHIPGALLLPLEGAMTWPEEYEKTVAKLIASKKPVVTYCA